MFKHKHTMAVKTITVTENDYNTLKGLKKEEESFSESILRISNDEIGNLSRFFGALKNSSKELDIIRKKVKEGRNKVDKDAREKMKKLWVQLYGHN